jgi:hypothetical protein
VAMADLFARAGIDPASIGCTGLFVLRATLMSPYHVLAAESGHGNRDRGVLRVPAPEDDALLDGRGIPTLGLIPQATPIPGRTFSANDGWHRDCISDSTETTWRVPQS